MSPLIITTPFAPVFDITSGLIGHWPLDMPNGPAINAVPGSSDINATGTITYRQPPLTSGGLTGSPTNASTFHGAGGFGADVGFTLSNDRTFFPDFAITIAIWFQAAPGSSGGASVTNSRHMIGWDRKGSVSNYYYLRMPQYVPSYGADVGKIRFNVRSIGDIQSPNDMRDGLPHQAVGTWDSAGDGKSRLYIDGALVATSVATRFSDFSGIPTSSLNFGIGQAPHGGGFGSEQANMFLDNGRVFSRAFTDSEVMALYDSEKQ